MNAIELTARHFEVARRLGAAGHRHGIEFIDQGAHCEIDPDLDLGAEGHTLGFHLLDTAVDQPFLHLELGDSIAQEAADAVTLFEQGDRMSDAGQLLRASEPGRPGADDCDRAAGPALRGLGHDPPLVPGAVDDLDLHLLDRHGVGVDAEHA